MTNPSEWWLSQGWRRETCPDCGGHGVICDYGSGEDFYGDKECRCNGSGVVWRSPQGRYLEFPGGRFV